MANMKYDLWQGRAFEIHRYLLEQYGCKVTREGDEWFIELPARYTMRDVQRHWETAVEIAKSQSTSPEPSTAATDTVAPTEEIPSGPGTRR